MSTGKNFGYKGRIIEYLGEFLSTVEILNTEEKFLVPRSILEYNENSCRYGMSVMPAGNDGGHKEKT